MVPDLPDAALWQAAVARVLKGADPATLVSRSRDGIAIAPLYGPAEPAASGRRGAPVAIVQPVDSPDPDEAARLAASDQDGGATVLTLVFAGAPAARGFGLPPEGVGVVLAAIDPARVSLRWEMPADRAEATTALDHLRAACERQGVSLRIAADPLGAALSRGDADLPTVADRWLGHVASQGSVQPLFTADGRPHHEAGASEAQELAAVLATGVHALRALERAGLTGQRIGFTLAADADQLFTIAKLRALRRLWARVEALCGLAPEPVAIHAETAWRMLARADPWTNLLRGTIACAGAILGGADSVAVLPLTGALGLSDAFARRLARNTPLVLLEEAGLGRVADPLAGSGAIEALTEALCLEAWRLFQDVEREGGIAAALMAGTWQARLAATRRARADDLAAGPSRLVGVTAFQPAPETPAPTVLRPLRRRQITSTGVRFTPLPSVRDAEPFEVEAELRDDA